MNREAVTFYIPVRYSSSDYRILRSANRFVLDGAASVLAKAVAQNDGSKRKRKHDDDDDKDALDHNFKF
jgi:hypothetical protein